MKRNDMPLNDVEWPKDEDYIPDDADHLPGCGCPECDPDDDGPRGDEEYDEDYDPHEWLDDDDDYGPDDDGGESALAV